MYSIHNTCVTEGWRYTNANSVMQSVVSVCLRRAGVRAVFVGVCVGVCYRSNSKFRASVLTPQQKVMTISS